MMLTDGVLGFAINLAADTGTSTEKAAFYGMWSALGVALIGGVFALLKQWLHTGDGETSGTKGRRLVKEHEAFERFLLLNGFEARKIKTGYESVEEVRRAVVPPEN